MASNSQELTGLGTHEIEVLRCMCILCRIQGQLRPPADRVTVPRSLYTPCHKPVYDSTGIVVWKSRMYIRICPTNHLVDMEVVGFGR